MELTIEKVKAPYIKKPVSVWSMLLDVLIAITPITIFSLIYGGWETLIMYLLSDLVIISAEIIFLLIINYPKKAKEAFKKFDAHNILAPLISSHLFILTMPPLSIKTGWYVIIISALFGIIVGKLVFGGFGSNIFNPAAVSRIFAGICFKKTIDQSFVSDIDGVTGGTVLGQLKESVTYFNNFNLTELFLGFNPKPFEFVQGAIGETCVILSIIGAIYLFARRSADIRVTLSLLITFVVLISFAGLAIYVKNKDLNVGKYIAGHLLSGGLIFGAIFMATDPVTSPISKVGRIAYGSLIAIFTVLIRLFGAFPEGMAFSILIGNACTPLLDSPKFATNKYRFWHPFIWVGVIGVLVGLFFIVL